LIVTDRTAIVTGASRGIGKQIAIELGRSGLNVVVAARSVSPHRGLAGSIGETVDAVRAVGAEAIAVETDVRSEDSVRRLMTTAIDRFGAVDVLVNNAADTSGGTPGVTELAFDDWLRQFDTNLHGPLRLIQAAVPEMRKRGGGVIVNMTSGAGDLVPDPLFGGPSVLAGERLAYASSKAALNRLENALAPELSRDRIAIVNVDPGFTRTELVDRMVEKDVVDGSTAIPMSVPTRAVVHLVTSGEAARFTGQVIRAESFVRGLDAL
jgi:NAD(P)-dependent dehydrogenase (short-subunit alcohol dehydrogenase family)